MLLDIDEGTLQATAERLGDGEVMAIVSDVSQPHMVQDAVSRVVDRFSRIDALVNNAGIAGFKPQYAECGIKQSGGFMSER